VAWIKLDDHFSDHPKILTQGHFAPFITTIQVRAFCYAGRYLTDGFIPKAVTASFTRDFEEWSITVLDQVIKPASEHDWPTIMCASGLWKQTESGYMIHDYLQYNPSKAEVLEERAKAKERMQKARSPEVQKKFDRTSQEVRLPPSPSPSPSPIPIPSTTKKKEKTLAHSENERQGFDTFWEAYPKKVGKGEARKAWHRKGDVALDHILEAIQKQKRSWSDPKFIPNPATWLNQERWDDEPVTSGAQAMWDKAQEEKVNDT